MAKFIKIPITGGQLLPVNAETITAMHRSSNDTIIIYSNNISLTLTVATDATQATFNKFVAAVDTVIDPMRTPYSPVTVDATATDYSFGILLSVEVTP